LVTGASMGVDKLIGARWDGSWMCKRVFDAALTRA
jgi:hypothetical protein